VPYLRLRGVARIVSMKIINRNTPPEERLKLIKALRGSPRSKADLAALDSCERAVQREIEADVIRLHSLGIKWE
jgi:hypothetical protein